MLISSYTVLRVSRTTLLLRQASPSPYPGYTGYAYLCTGGYSPYSVRFIRVGTNGPHLRLFGHVGMGKGISIHIYPGYTINGALQNGISGYSSAYLGKRYLYACQAIKVIIRSYIHRIGSREGIALKLAGVGLRISSNGCYNANC